MSISFSLLKKSLAVCRLPPGSPIPAWALNGSFWSITQTVEELSLVCDQLRVPNEIRAVRDWRAIKVEGPLDFGLTGILAGLAGALADSGISLFAIATFDTDYILVKDEKIDQAIQALMNVGYHYSGLTE